MTKEEIHALAVEVCGTMPSDMDSSAAELCVDWATMDIPKDEPDEFYAGLMLGQRFTLEALARFDGVPHFSEKLATVACCVTVAAARQIINNQTKS